MSFFRRMRLALRFTLGKRAGEGSRPLGAIVGIAIAIVPLVVVVHVSDAMITGIADRFIETGTYHLRARPRFAVESERMEDKIAELRQIEGVTYAAAERNGFALVYHGENRTGVQVRAVAPDIYRSDPGFRRYLDLDQGEFAIEGREDIVIGRSIAETLGVGSGDSLRVLTVRSLPGGGILPRVSSFTVRGVVSTGYQELDRLWVFMNLERGSSILPPEDTSLSIGVKVAYPMALPNDLFSESPDRTEHMLNVVEQVETVLGSTYRVRTWFQEEQSRYLAFGTTRTALVVVMVLIMAVAAVNISSSMVLLVLSRQHDIGVLKALGAAPADIRALFLMIGGLIGFIGAGIGTLAGVILSTLINQLLQGLEFAAGMISALLTGSPIEGSVIGGDFYLEVIPVQILVGSSLTIWGAAVLLAVASSLVPAFRAAAVRPMQVLYRR
ncbi:ABC transporter permease [Spirochaeta africana]|uniref:ABC-type transport system, involved in lipoprotein release, permease component n=1 Tax=Spirochaeta africana (strain ATCC 700263 / DSM 8902 / Z-7692) TaxID=889378 RepID=H9UI06_SPIAZ|nr:ABC transporter permease [Spirochaeta africana]AFG37149.1 ABC-type transport system, involved in lipoprotein release, permease component [Spirochaeta africana DSM 8902]